MKYLNELLLFISITMITVGIWTSNLSLSECYIFQGGLLFLSPFVLYMAEQALQYDEPLL
jgi:hypothetical protein